MKLAIVHGKVLTMSDKVKKVIPGGTVLVHNGIIEQILEKEAPIPPEYRLMDAKGCFVLPGFIEAHCHMGITEEKKGMEGDDCNEGVDPVTPSLRAIDAINPMDDAFHNAVRAGITAAMIGPGSSNVVGGQFVVVNNHGRCIDDMVLRFPAALKVAFGENPKVNYSGMGKSPSTRMAIAAMLRKELLSAKQYLNSHKKDEETDLRFEAYRQVFERKIPIKAHVHRADDILTAIRIAKEFQLDMTLDHCSEGHLIAEEIKASGFPAIVGPDLASRNKIEVQNMAFKTAGILSKAGVLTAITTDHPVSIIQTLPLCAAMAVKEGMEMEEALKAITINAAKICRVDDKIGSLEPGKQGDIVIYDGHPFDIFTRTMCTMIRGEIVYRAPEFFI
ncbi:MAG: amidohydrolase [Lachnospiraceae bacterium]|nr:amidohydrolase [Lachnospiraceae bacterium]